MVTHFFSLKNGLEIVELGQNSIAVKSRCIQDGCHTYHLRTLSIAIIARLMSSLARLRVSARNEREIILLPAEMVAIVQDNSEQTNVRNKSTAVEPAVTDDNSPKLGAAILASPRGNTCRVFYCR